MLLYEVITSNSSVVNVIDHRILAPLNSTKVYIAGEGSGTLKLSDFRSPFDLRFFDASRILFKRVNLEKRATLFLLDSAILDLDRLG